MYLWRNINISNINISNDNRISSDPIIKQEDVFYTAKKKYKETNKQLNPLTKQRKVSRCAICDSKMYWTKNCQHKHPQNANIIETSNVEEIGEENEVEDVNFVLMTTQNPRKDFVDEMIAKAAIDTAGTKTVAGEFFKIT